MYNMYVTYVLTGYIWGKNKFNMTKKYEKLKFRYKGSTHNKAIFEHNNSL